MEQFYPSFLSIKKSDNTWTLGKVFNDEGTYSIIYDVMNQNDKIYALKFMDIDGEDNIKQVIKEVEFSDKAGKLGIAPQMIEAWICEKGLVIIMEKLDKTVGELLTQYKTPLVRYLIIENVLKLLDVLHQNNISHGDSHIFNFMVKESLFDSSNLEYQKYTLAKYKYYIIDFGASEEGTKETKSHDYLDLIGFLPKYFSNEIILKLFSSRLTKEELIRFFGKKKLHFWKEKTLDIL